MPVDFGLNGRKVDGSLWVVKNGERGAVDVLVFASRVATHFIHVNYYIVWGDNY